MASNWPYEFDEPPKPFPLLLAVTILFVFGMVCGIILGG